MKVPHTGRFFRFLQLMANRFAVGHLRYGEPQSKQRYYSRLKEELKTYKKTGNLENLLNVAVYAFLESQAPESMLKLVHDNTAPSATRRTFGGNRA